MRLRFVEVDVTEPQFGGSEDAPTFKPHDFDVAEGERIVGVESFRVGSGVMGHDFAVRARVWIVTE